MKIRQAALFDTVAEVQAPVISFTAALVIGLIGAGLYETLEGRISGAVIFFGGIILMVSHALVNWAIKKWLFKINIKPLEPVPLKRGLIVLVSPGKFDEIPALGAIKHHFRGEHDERVYPTLENLWLLCSKKQTEEPEPPIQSSYENACDLERRYKPHIYVDVIQINDPDNPAEVFSRAQHAYDEAARLDVAPAELVADVTGGTKSMSVGLAYAALPSSRDMQFMKPRKYTSDGRAIAKDGADARLIDVTFVEQSKLFRSIERRARR